MKNLKLRQKKEVISESKLIKMAEWVLYKWERNGLGLDLFEGENLLWNLKIPPTKLAIKLATKSVCCQPLATKLAKKAL